jgi:hypothetical protein
MLHERVHHAHGRAPRAVRGADRLHDVFEDGWSLEHPSRAGRCPREVGIVLRFRVEARQVVVETKDVPNTGDDVLSHTDARRRPEDLDHRVCGTAPLTDADAPRLAPP